jgi:hypothetical protein
MGPPSKSDVARDADAPNRLLAPRERCGSIGCFIGLQNTPASFGGRRCEPSFAPTPKLAIERRMGGTGGDALSTNDIPIEVWRCLEYMAILWLTKVFNHTFWSNNMPKE